MKINLKILFISLVLLVTFAACTPDDDIFDESLLYGTWVSNTEYYTYNEDGTGVSWDTDDDVEESEAQSFRWILERSNFTHIHILEIGGETPKHYKLLMLTAGTLKYKDDFNTFIFTKVK